MMKYLIETERLLLRDLSIEDDKGMFELDSDPEVHRFLGNKPVANIEESRKIILFIREQYEQNGIGRWAAIEKESNAFIGWAGLKLIKDTFNKHTGYYDLGYRFIKRYWGKGYATEAAKAAVSYGFNTLDMPYIYGMADINNLASRNVLEKAGLSYIETFILNDEPIAWYKMNNPNIIN